MSIDINLLQTQNELMKKQIANLQDKMIGAEQTIAELQDKLNEQNIIIDNLKIAHNDIQKTAVDFRDKLHRRNLQIADLKKKLHESEV